MRGKQAQRKTACCLPTPRHPFGVALFPMIQLCATFAFHCILSSEKVCLVHIDRVVTIKNRHLQWIRTHNIKECEQRNTLYPIRAAWAYPILTPLHPEMQMKKRVYYVVTAHLLTRRPGAHSTADVFKSSKVIEPTPENTSTKSTIIHPSLPTRGPTSLSFQRQQNWKKILRKLCKYVNPPCFVMQSTEAGAIEPHPFAISTPDYR
ncbi:hypothetical protein CAMY_08930 [Corynebacterium amycolatum]